MVLAYTLTGVAVLSGIAFIWSTYAGSDVQRYLLKPLTTLLIFAIAWALPDPVAPLYRFFVMVGLLFSMAGDIFLMLPGDRFVFGLASFLIAHIFYILAYRTRGGYAFTWWLFAIYAAYTAILVYLLWPQVGAVRIPVLIYALVLMVMGWQAAEQWWQWRDLSALLAMVGAVLFLASDSMLALNKFRAPIPQQSLLVMSTYYAAQLLIAWSVYAFRGI